MQKFHVTYYYCAQGMEGRADVDDYGVVEANSANSAKKKVAHEEALKATIKTLDNEKYRRIFDWMMGCLDATLVTDKQIRKLYGNLYD